MAKNPTYGQLAGAAARAMAADGRKVSGADPLAALESVSAIRFLVAELFEGVDLVSTQTAAARPALPKA
jgi:hypothetical protein